MNNQIPLKVIFQCLTQRTTERQHIKLTMIFSQMSNVKKKREKKTISMSGYYKKDTTTKYQTKRQILKKMYSHIYNIIQ